MMRILRKEIIGIGVVAFLALAVISVIKYSNETRLSTAANEYHPSNEVIAPYDLSKNPYKWKDHSGILDTIDVPIVMRGGRQLGSVPYPGGALRFNKMIDAHTATYAVMVGNEDVEPDGEIAVILKDNDPPDSGRLWRIFVEGPLDGTNGLGQNITLTAVRFEGYYTPPPQPVQATPPAHASQTPDQQQPTEVDQPAQAKSSMPSTYIPEVSSQPAPMPVAVSSPPTHEQTIAEIDQQAIVLWNQKRYADALPLFNQTCSGGNAESCFHLGMMYDFGQDVEQDFPRARGFYLRACNFGNQSACKNLSILMSYEPDFPQCNSTSLAVMVNRYNDSCNAGNSMSCITLGHLYSYGCSVTKNPERAQQLYSKACAIGDQLGCDRLKEMQ